jgi:hypothetical protein
MSFAVWCIIIGAVAAGASYGLKDLFVDASDVNNPMRTLVSGMGYVGVVVAAYGVILVIVGALR